MIFGVFWLVVLRLNALKNNHIRIAANGCVGILCIHCPESKPGAEQVTVNANYRIFIVGVFIGNKIRPGQEIGSQEGDHKRTRSQWGFSLKKLQES